ncbi:MAG: hypothetical protein A2X36_09915 [Elusimicrobia bacterium GWA2_69_24]|nr:MAG: hypothetical protein A2X36_09915 [Elusimicrobia bacterium GWA2_69_24]HBL17584.1 hypothetical protein [Elusimicrobiota bacterium]
MTELFGFSTLHFAVLGVLVFLAGVVDSLAGGGGIITLPAYAALGLPLPLVLGTNKCSSTIGTVVSVLRYFGTLKLSLRALAPMALAALVGSAIGAGAAMLLDPGFIRWALLLMLPFVMYSVLVKHHFGLSDLSGGFTRKELGRRSVAVAFPIGAYDGFFGPGTGTFLALGLSRFCRYDLLQATGYAKALNLASNAAALAAFLYAGRVHIPLGAAMGVMSVAGHWVGSHLGLRRGTAAIRPAIAFISGLLLLKTAYDLFGGRF